MYGIISIKWEKLVLTTGHIILLIFASIHNVHGLDTILACICAIMSGVSGYIYSAQSAKFAYDNKFSATQILATRFWLLLLISFMYVLIEQKSITFSLNIAYYCIVLGVITLIIPIYLLQDGILKLGAAKNAIIRGYTPCLALMIQSIIFFNYDVVNLLLSILLGLIITCSINQTTK